MNSPSFQTRVQDKMAGATGSVEEFLVDFLTPILPKIGVKPTREGFIHMHPLISGNEAYVVSNLRWGQHGQLAMTMTAYVYME